MTYHRGADCLLSWQTALEQTVCSQADCLHPRWADKVQPEPNGCSWADTLQTWKQIASQLMVIVKLMYWSVYKYWSVQQILISKTILINIIATTLFCKLLQYMWGTYVTGSNTHTNVTDIVMFHKHNVSVNSHRLCAWDHMQQLFVDQASGLLWSAHIAQCKLECCSGVVSCPMTLWLAAMASHCSIIGHNEFAQNRKASLEYCWPDTNNLTRDSI